MKLETLNLAPQTVTSSVFQQRSEKKLIDQLNPKPGQSCFEYDHTTGEIKLATFTEINAHLAGKVERKIIVNPGHLYAVAINKQNAWKKFVKMIKGQ